MKETGSSPSYNTTAGQAYQNLPAANTSEKTRPGTTRTQRLARVVLGGFLILAGIGHLSFARTEFQAQVPDWVPIEKDLVVILSGIVEIGLGAALVFLVKHQVKVGWIAAAFFIAVFPGNIAQYLGHRDGFGLDSDAARLARLFFQPVLVALALWSTGTWFRKTR